MSTRTRAVRSFSDANHFSYSAAWRISIKGTLYHMGYVDAAACVWRSSMASAARGEPDEKQSGGLFLDCERHMARTPALQQALSNAWLKTQGLVSVKDLWCKAQGYTT